MELYGYGVLGFAPGLLWLWLLHRRDVLEPEPWRLVILVFALGCGSAFATLALRPHLEPLIPWEPVWLRDLADAFAVTAFVEEALKFAAFFAGIYWLRELDEPMDGIVYGAAAGLGFASVENALYLHFTESWALILPRAFTSTLAHVACSATVGFTAGLGRLASPRRSWLLAVGLALAVLLHGAYDYFLFGFDSGLWWLSLLGALPLMLVLLLLKMRWALARSRHYHPHLS